MDVVVKFKGDAQALVTVLNQVSSSISNVGKIEIQAAVQGAKADQTRQRSTKATRQADIEAAKALTERAEATKKMASALNAMNRAEQRHKQLAVETTTAVNQQIRASARLTQAQASAIQVKTRVSRATIPEEIALKQSRARMAPYRERLTQAQAARENIEARRKILLSRADLIPKREAITTAQAEAIPQRKVLLSLQVAKAEQQLEALKKRNLQLDEKALGIARQKLTVGEKTALFHTRLQAVMARGVARPQAEEIVKRNWADIQRQAEIAKAQSAAVRKAVEAEQRASERRMQQIQRTSVLRTRAPQRLTRESIATLASLQMQRKQFERPGELPPEWLQKITLPKTERLWQGFAPSIFPQQEMARFRRQQEQAQRQGRTYFGQWGRELKEPVIPLRISVAPLVRVRRAFDELRARMRTGLTTRFPSVSPFLTGLGNVINRFRTLTAIASRVPGKISRDFQSLVGLTGKLQLPTLSGRKAKVEVDTSQLSRAREEINRTNQHIRRQSDHLGSNARAWGGALQAIGRFRVALGLIKWALVFAGFYGLVSAIKAIIVNSVRMASTFQTLSARLYSVLRDENLVAAAMQKMSLFAKRTPFELEEVTDAFVRMSTYGLKPTEKRMKTIGDFAASMGRTFTDAVEAIADATRGEFERIREFGITKPMIQAMGKNLIDAKGRIKDYALYQEKLFSLMERVSAGAMERMMNTIAGRWSNLKDAASRIFLGLGQSIENPIKNVLLTLTNVLENWSRSAHFGKIKEAIKAAFAPDRIRTFLTAFLTFVFKAGDSLEKIKGYFAEFTSALSVKTFLSLLNSIKTIFEGILHILTPVAWTLEKIINISKELSFKESWKDFMDSWKRFKEGIWGEGAGIPGTENGPPITRGLGGIPIQRLAPLPVIPSGGIAPLPPATSARQLIEAGPRAITPGAPRRPETAADQARKAVDLFMPVTAREMADEARRLAEKRGRQTSASVMAIMDYIKEEATRTEVPMNLLRALLQKEPGWAKIAIPAQQARPKVRGAAEYLAQLQKQFTKEEDVVSAYLMPVGAKAGGAAVPADIKKRVDAILKEYHRLDTEMTTRGARPQPSPITPEEEEQFRKDLAEARTRKIADEEDRALSEIKDRFKAERVEYSRQYGDRKGFEQKKLNELYAGSRAEEKRLIEQKKREFARERRQAALDEAEANAELIQDELERELKLNKVRFDRLREQRQYENMEKKRSAKDAQQIARMMRGIDAAELQEAEKIRKRIADKREQEAREAERAARDRFDSVENFYRQLEERLEAKRGAMPEADFDQELAKIRSQLAKAREQEALRALPVSPEYYFEQRLKAQQDLNKNQEDGIRKNISLIRLQNREFETTYENALANIPDIAQADERILNLIDQQVAKIREQVKTLGQTTDERAEAERLEQQITQLERDRVDVIRDAAAVRQQIHDRVMQNIQNRIQAESKADQQSLQALARMISDLERQKNALGKSSDEQKESLRIESQLVDMERERVGILLRIAQATRVPVGEAPADFEKRRQAARSELERLEGKDWEQNTADRRRQIDAIGELEDRRAAIRRSQHQQHIQDLREEIAQLRFGERFKNILADQQQWVEVQVRLTLEAEQQNKLRNTLRGIAEEAKSSFQGAAQSFLEGLISGTVKAKDAFKKLLMDFRMLAARALSELIVEKLKGQFRDLFGGIFGGKEKPQREETVLGKVEPKAGTVEGTLAAIWPNIQTGITAEGTKERDRILRESSIGLDKLKAAVVGIVSILTAGKSRLAQALAALAMVIQSLKASSGGGKKGGGGLFGFIGSIIDAIIPGKGNTFAQIGAVADVVTGITGLTGGGGGKAPSIPGSGGGVGPTAPWPAGGTPGFQTMAEAKPMTAMEGFAVPDIPPLRVPEIKAPKIPPTRLEMETPGVDVSVPKISPLRVEPFAMPRIEMPKMEPIGVKTPDRIPLDLSALPRLSVDAPVIPPVSVGFDRPPRMQVSLPPALDKVSRRESPSSPPGERPIEITVHQNIQRVEKTVDIEKAWEDISWIARRQLRMSPT